jgi:hypothetical protein
MKQTRVRAPKSKTIPRPFARYARAAILAHPDLVHRIAQKLRRPAILQPTARRPSRLGT